MGISGGSSPREAMRSLSCCPWTGSAQPRSAPSAARLWGSWTPWEHEDEHNNLCLLGSRQDHTNTKSDPAPSHWGWNNIARQWEGEKELSTWLLFSYLNLQPWFLICIWTSSQLQVKVHCIPMLLQGSHPSASSGDCITVIQDFYQARSWTWTLRTQNRPEHFLISF